MSDRVYLNLSMPKELDTVLEYLADRSSCEKAQIIAKAFALFEQCTLAKDRGEEVWLLKDGEPVREVIGF